jgi:hypothetical protein
MPRAKIDESLNIGANAVSGRGDSDIIELLHF